MRVLHDWGFLRNDPVQCGSETVGIMDAIGSYLQQAPEGRQTELYGYALHVQVIGHRSRCRFEHVLTNTHPASDGSVPDWAGLRAYTRSVGIPMAIGVQLISLEAVGEKHDAIRGQRNAWRHAIATIEALVKRQKQLRLKLSVNQTIVDDQGVENYLRLRDYLKPLDIQNHIVIGYKKSAMYHQAENVRVDPKNGRPFNPFVKFNDLKLKRLFDVVQEDIHCHPPITRAAKRYYTDGIKNRLLDHTAYPNPKCVALSSHLRLLPDGALPTCQFNTAAVGNLRHQSFTDIWHGNLIMRQRQWASNCEGC